MVEEKSTPHDWKPEDDILAFYLHRFGERGEITKNRVANCIGIPVRKLNPRISDFKKLERKTIDNHTCSKEEKIYDKYHKCKEDEHRKKCLEILENK